MRRLHTPSARSGMSIMEIVLALCVLAMATVVFLTVFSNSGSQALQTRNRTAAILLANSLIDEIEAHPYGDKEPLSWADGVKRPATVVVAGRDQQMEFHQSIDYENYSFIGGGSGEPRDMVTIVLTWKESAGGDQTSKGRADDNKELIVRVPVWR